MVLASLSVFAGSLGVDEAHKPEPIQTVVNDDALATDIHGQGRQPATKANCK